MPVDHAVDGVSEDASADQAEEPLNGASLELQAVAEAEDSGECDECEEGKRPSMPGEDAPGGALVADVDDLEKAIDDNDVPGVHLQVPEYPELGRLVGCEDGQRGQVEAKVGDGVVSARPFICKPVQS